MDVELASKLEDAERWACCAWPRRGIIAEHGYAKLLGLVRAAAARIVECGLSYEEFDALVDYVKEVDG